MSHLEREIALTAGPLTVAVERIPGQEIPGLTSLAQHRGDHGAELTGVTTPLTLTVKVPLAPQPPPPLVRPQQRAVVLHRDLLPGPHVAPGLQSEVVAGVEAEPGVADTTVVTQSEGGKYSATIET